MVIIGITGGVGAGKSEVLKYIKDQCSCKILLADDVGNEVKKKGQSCFDELISLLGVEVIGVDGEIDRAKMAAKIFADREILQKVNELIHPAVKKYIMQSIEEEKAKKQIQFFFVEAALLIECGYKTMLDELWYIYATEDVRRKRLKELRGYDDSRIDGILSKQLKEEEFRKNADRVIDNSGNLEDTKTQIDEILGDPLWKMQ